jgi:hypothetical protein
MRYGEDDSNDGEDPFFGDFSVYGADPQASAYRMPTAAPYAPPASLQPGVPQMTPDFIRQLQQGASTVGNAAQSGALSNMFAPGTLSPFDPLAEYAKTAPILSLKGNKEYENLNFQALPDTKYQLTVGGNVVGSASNPEEVARLVQQANAISEQGGKAVDVRLQKEVQAATRTGEPITVFEDVYANKENNTGALGTLLPAALAAMGGAALGPLLGGASAAGKVGLLGASKLAGAAGAGLGSAAGSFAGSIGTGASIEDALKKAAISGVTAGVLKGAMPGGSSGGMGPMPDIDYAGLNNIVFGGGAALPSAALEPILTATAGRLAGAALPSVFGGAASGLASSALNSQNQGSVKPDEPTLEALGVRDAQPPAPAGGGVANFISAAESLGRMPETIEEEATVTGRRYDDPNLGASFAVPVTPSVVDAGYSVFAGDEPMLESSPDRLQREDFSSPLVVPPVAPLPTFEAPFTGVDTTVPGEDPEQVVTGTKVPPATLPPTTLTFPDAPFAVPPTTIPPFEAPPTVEEPKKGGGTLKKVLGGLTLLDILSGAVGGGGGGTTTGGAGKLNPIFSAKLPGASPAFSQQSLAPRPGGVSGAPMTDIDWYRYGYNPERSFFNYVPATEAEREAMMVKPPSQLEQKARGGAMAVKKGGAPVKESFAVKGPGTGRSDEIPALLSDGEYVIDAETVALLGDGSSEAGAKRLDDFRVSIRKHKGSNLARGKFSANARRPEKYLSGGRV